MTTIKDYFPSPSNTQTEPTDSPAASAKRTRSDNSSAGSHEQQERKKLHEELELSVEALAFESDTPHWVGLMFSSLGVIREDMCSIQQNMTHVLNKVDELSEFKEAITTQIGELETSVKFIGAKYDDREKEHDDILKRIEKLEKSNGELRESNKKLAAQVDSNEQHSRNECLVLHGIPESENEKPQESARKFVEAISTKLDLAMATTDVKRCHRLGFRREDGKPRSIILRFQDMNFRNKVYANKRKFKGSNIALTENLTACRLSVLKEAGAKYGLKNVWSQEGRIYADNGHAKINIK